MQFICQLTKKIKQLKYGPLFEFLGVILVIYMGRNISSIDTQTYFQGVVSGVGFMMIFFGKHLVEKLFPDNN